MTHTVERFSDREYERRRHAVREAMGERGLDLLLIYGADRERKQQNLRYLTNWTDPFYAYIVFPLRREPTLLNGLSTHTLFAKSVSVVEDTRWGTSDLAGGVCARIRELGLEKARIGIVGQWGGRSPHIFLSFAGLQNPLDSLVGFEPQLEQLQTCVTRGRPCGEPEWVQRTAQRLDLMFTLRNVGRPRTKGRNE